MYTFTLYCASTFILSMHKNYSSYTDYFAYLGLFNAAWLINDGAQSPTTELHDVRFL